MVNEDNRVHDIGRPRNEDTTQLVRQLSRILYKLAFFCKTKPICRGCEIKVSSVFIKGYEEKARLASQSKQSQTKPISMLRWVNTISERSRMETGGIEPPFPRCDRGVLPLYHVPGFTRIPYFSKPFLNSRLGITVVS